MKNLLLAAAAALALPALAHAQTAPTPVPAKECCCKKMADKDCCAERDAKKGGDQHDDHAGHDMSKMQPPK